VELRRALLLFALVLGLAAIVTSISQPRESGRHRKPSVTPPEADAPTARPRPPLRSDGVVRFPRGRHPVVRALRAGEAAQVVVEVSQPGQVEIEGVGLSEPAEPETPARFDVLLAEPGRYEVAFTPAARVESRRIGTLVVRRVR
jgi:hypothetical protein